MSELPATMLLPLPAGGRRFSAGRTVRLGDVDPSGELRLDAIARYLQDVASDDAIDAGLSNALGWVVRRTMIRVARPPTVGDPLSLITFCSATGRSWAERRTTISDQHGSAVEAVSVWVHVDTATGRPARLGHDFAGIYGDAAGGRTVSSKLPLPSVPSDAPITMRWTFRRTDLDPFGHVNNAAHWAVLEQVLQSEAASRVGVGEIDFVSPAEADTPIEIVSARGRVDADADVREVWSIVDDRVVTAFRWTPSVPVSG